MRRTFLTVMCIVCALLAVGILHGYVTLPEKRRGNSVADSTSTGVRSVMPSAPAPVSQPGMQQTGSQQAGIDPRRFPSTFYICGLIKLLTTFSETGITSVILFYTAQVGGFSPQENAYCFTIVGFTGLIGSFIMATTKMSAYPVQALRVGLVALPAHSLLSVQCALQIHKTNFKRVL